jgi:hypothetical protein
VPTTTYHYIQWSCEEDKSRDSLNTPELRRDSLGRQAEKYMNVISFCWEGYFEDRESGGEKGATF